MPPQAPLLPGTYKVAPIDSDGSADETVHASNLSSKRDQLIQDNRLVLAQGKVKVGHWGYPGYLNESQAIALETLRTEVKKRNQDFQETIFTNRDSKEDEAYALCRWLRSYKFNVNKTIRKVEEATVFSADARKNNYYHSPTHTQRALGIAPSIYLQQFPQFYYGVSKSGLPIFYAKAGVINTKAIGCITSTDGVLQFHWQEMYQQRNEAFQKLYNSSNGNFKRYEILYILDLKGLSTSQLNKQLINTTKMQCKIDELCFPDSMIKMIIVNAPSCFPMIWRLIKTWIDPRNASKVEIFGFNRSQWEKRIHEFVEKDQLPSDYGGLERNGTSVDIMRQQMIEQYKMINPDHVMVDEKTHIMTFHHQESSRQVEVKRGLKLALFIYTNSKSGGTLQIIDKEGNHVDGIPSQGLRVSHEGGNNDSEGDVSTSTQPTKYDLTEMGINLDIPGFYDLKISLNEKLRGNFLLVTQYYKEKKKEEKEVNESIPSGIKRRKVLGPGDNGLKSFSLGVGKFSIDDDANDHQVDFYPYEYLCEC